MEEIGGYIELDTYHGKMLHDDGVLLNCGRAALIYLIYLKKITKIKIPKFICESVFKVCDRFSEGKIFPEYWNIEISYYSINNSFLPQDINLVDDEWLYVVDYYGQVGNVRLQEMKEKYGRIIIDYSQNYFAEPIIGVDSIYTCRKFFGVSDGAILYTDAISKYELPYDSSYNRMRYILGRYEESASFFYEEYKKNDGSFECETVKYMSKLTYNLLHGIDYERVKQVRTSNFMYLHERLDNFNELELQIPEGAFMYPFYNVNGNEIRRKLLSKKIYVPVLWPNILRKCKSNELEYDMAKNIIPLPVDQRYGIREMERIIREIKNILNE